MDTLVGLGPLLAPLNQGLLSVLHDLPHPEFQHVEELDADQVDQTNWADTREPSTYDRHTALIVNAWGSAVTNCVTAADPA